MKLASLKTGGRDGTLIVVSRDLSTAVEVPDIAKTLQSALDDWANTEPRLNDVYGLLSAGEAQGAFDLNINALAAPLPRAYQWADGSAYVNHVELVRKARGAEVPESFWTDPLMYQGGSDSFIAARDAVMIESEDWGIDFEAEVAVITDDVPMGASAEHARNHIKLLMLVNDVSLRNLIPAELAKGFGFFHSKPATAFSPVAITPDELGTAWDNAKVNLPMLVDYNGDRFGQAKAGEDMTFNFAQLVSHAAKSRYLCAGSVIGSGTISNRDADGGPGKPVADGGLGYSCIAEVRMVEKILTGEMKTSFMKFGDTIKINMQSSDGDSLFGSIEQTIQQYKKPV